MNELITVIIPVYKVERYLKKCVDSVLSQTYRDLEIILVDDGSPDNCGSICDSYALADGRVRVIHKPNGGLSDARNAAMEVSKGDYITFIDSDDSVDEKYVETLYRLLKDNGADMSAIPLDSVDEDGKSLGFCGSGKVRFLDDSQAIAEMFKSDGIPWCAQAKLCRTALFEGIRYPVGVLMEDKATTYKVFARCKKIVYADLALYKYLVRSGSIMRSSFSDKRLKSFDVQLELNDFIEKNYPETLPVTRAYTVRTAIALLCMMSADGYADFEGSEKLFGYVASYKKDFFKSDVTDKRFRLVGRAICFLRALRKDKIYSDPFYKLLTKKVGAVFSAK